MSEFTLHKFVRLVNLQGVMLAHKDLRPAFIECNLPHAIICDKRIFLLMERHRALYHEVMPHLINEPLTN